MIIVKLIITIIDDDDVDKVMRALTEQHIGITHISSTGGLLSPGSSTLLVGVDELRAQRVMRGIAEQAAPRGEIVPYPHDSTTAFASPVEVQVGGYITFVIDVDHFEQV